MIAGIIWIWYYFIRLVILGTRYMVIIILNFFLCFVFHSMVHVAQKGVEMEKNILENFHFLFPFPFSISFFHFPFSHRFFYFSIFFFFLFLILPPFPFISALWHNLCTLVCICAEICLYLHRVEAALNNTVYFQLFHQKKLSKSCNSKKLSKISISWNSFV